MNKTILASVTIISLTFGVVSYWYIDYLKVKAEANDINSVQVARNEFTRCIQVVMSESRQSGKVVDAEKAKEICVHVKDGIFEKKDN